MSKKTEEQRAPRLERYLGHMERRRRRSKSQIEDERVRKEQLRFEANERWNEKMLKNRGDFRAATARPWNRRLKRIRRRIAAASRARNRR